MQFTLTTLLLSAALPFTNAYIRAALGDCPEPECCAPEVVNPSEYYGLYSFNDTRTGNGPNSVSRRTYFETYFYDNGTAYERIDTILAFRNVECTGETHWNPSIDFSYQPKITPDKDLVFSDNEVTFTVQQITNNNIPIDVSYAQAEKLEYRDLGTFRLPGKKSADFEKSRLIHIGQVPCSQDLGFRFSLNNYMAGQKSYNYYPACPTSGVGLRYGCCQYSQDCLH